MDCDDDVEEMPPEHKGINGNGCDKRAKLVADKYIGRDGGKPKVGGENDKVINGSNPDEQTIAGLAELGPLAYGKIRLAKAKALGIPVSALDKLVRQCRSEAEDEESELAHWQVEPWENAIDGAALLTDIEKLFRRYIVLPKGAGEALALWTLHAWTMDAGDISPFMMLLSPTKRCGKTNALTVLFYLTPLSELASNISPSALFRYIEMKHPTLVMDECDSFLKLCEEFRGILNSGHTRSAAHVIRNVEVEGDHKPRRFSTWGPKALAAIGALPDTLEDRSIIVRLQRKAKTAQVERLWKRDNDEFATLRRKIARWAADNFPHLAGDPEPKIPDALNDRAADNWRPLLAIAELAGDDWAKQAREAACLLSGEGHDADGILDTLLADIKAAFGKQEVMFSSDLVQHLAVDPERPWAEWKHGKPLTQKQLAGLLKPLLIFSRTVHPHGKGGSHGKGYRLEDFEEAFAAYLPGQNTSSVPTGTSEACTRATAEKSNTYVDTGSVHQGEGARIENASKSLNNKEAHGCTDRNGGNGRAGHFDQEEGLPADAFDEAEKHETALAPKAPEAAEQSGWWEVEI
jgi:putative DNA primase/helicase